MTFIYHGKPEDMKGHNLIPLNKMFETDRALHNQYLEKYQGREEILERKIPLLDCSWNDVVQFLPLHPKKIFEHQKQLGLIDNLPDYSYFEIDLGLLDPEKTVVYFKTAPGEEHVIVKWLRDVDIDELQWVPPATVDYYKRLVGKNEPVFNYQFVPHVLYRGSVDVSKSATISTTR